MVKQNLGVYEKDEKDIATSAFLYSNMFLTRCLMNNRVYLFLNTHLIIIINTWGMVLLKLFMLTIFFENH